MKEAKFIGLRLFLVSHQYGLSDVLRRFADNQQVVGDLKFRRAGRDDELAVALYHEHSNAVRQRQILESGAAGGNHVLDHVLGKRRLGEVSGLLRKIHVELLVLHCGLVVELQPLGRERKGPALNHQRHQRDEEDYVEDDLSMPVFNHIPRMLDENNFTGWLEDILYDLDDETRKYQINQILEKYDLDNPEIPDTEFDALYGNDSNDFSFNPYSSINNTSQSMNPYSENNFR